MRIEAILFAFFSSNLTAYDAKQASTYLNFFTATPMRPQPPDRHTIYSLLNHLTLHFYSILYAAPNSSDTLAASQPLLDLANRLLAAWNTWLTGLSSDVNHHGEMYPQPTVFAWANGLDGILHPNQPKDVPTSVWSARSASPWNLVGQPAVPLVEQDHPLVSSFQAAIRPIRDRFVSELGWLIGRTVSFSPLLTTTESVLQQHLKQSGWGVSWNRPNV